MLTVSAWLYTKQMESEAIVLEPDQGGVATLGLVRGPQLKSRLVLYAV